MKTINQLFTLVVKLLKHQKNNSAIDVPEKKQSWREVGGVIYFSVTSDGKTGHEWYQYFTKKGISLGYYVGSFLDYYTFRPSRKGTIYEVAILKGKLFKKEDLTKYKFTDGHFFCGQDLTSNNIRAQAENQKFDFPHAEVACLIRDKFTDEELKRMGLSKIVVMHEALKNFAGHFGLFSIQADNPDHSFFAYARNYNYNYEFSRNRHAFAFVVSTQVPKLGF